MIESLVSMFIIGVIVYSIGKAWMDYKKDNTTTYLPHHPSYRDDNGFYWFFIGNEWARYDNSDGPNGHNDFNEWGDCGKNHEQYYDYDGNIDF